MRRRASSCRCERCGDRLISACSSLIKLGSVADELCTVAGLLQNLRTHSAVARPARLAFAVLRSVQWWCVAVLVFVSASGPRFSLLQLGALRETIARTLKTTIQSHHFRTSAVYKIQRRPRIT